MLFNYQMHGNTLYFITAFLLVMISIFSIGMLVASICKTIKIANILPLTHGIKLLKSVSLGINDQQLWFSAFLLIAFTLVGCILAIVLFR